MKVLVISHNPICTYDNMGKTILSLFSCFKKEEICQLYVYPSMPDVDKCTSYFRITDREVIRSLRPFAKAPGDEITLSDELIRDFRVRSTKKDITQEQESFLFIMRDIAWKMSGWYSTKLKAWLDREAPEVIFFTPGSSKFIYDVADKISMERKIPVITYICDDFYFLNGKIGFFRSLQLKLLKKRIKRSLQEASGIITICEALRCIYSEEFSIPVHTVMTGAGIKRNPVKAVERIRNMSYFGNLTFNRYLNIAEIGRTLDSINKRTGQDVELRVYSRNDNKTVRAEFSGISSLKMMGYLAGDEYSRAFFDSDVLIHTEAFDETCMNRVRYSVSTKIADSLASGIMLFAYGPKGIASMDHLEDNGSAWIVNNRDELEGSIEEMLDNPNEREETACKGLRTAEQYHDSDANSLRIRTILAGAADGRRV